MMIDQKYIYSLVLAMFFWSNSLGQTSCPTVTNVSLNKTATQSSTASGQDASQAVDGITNLWSNFSQSNWSSQPWWEVDLGDIHTIEEVKVWGKEGDQVFKDYHVFISQNPFTSTDPNVLLNDPNVESSQLYTTVPFPPEVVPFNNVSGRYVRVQMIGTGFFKLGELEVMGCLSAGGPQNQTITFDPIPNKLTTDPPFTINATATSGLPVTFSIQSGPATISGNTITLNGVAGTVVVDANQAGDGNYNPAPTVSQSFVVNNPSSGGGCSATSNVSLNKTATQSSTASGQDASQAVDGITNLWSNFSQSNWSSQPWWEVDLGDIHTIEEVKVWGKEGDQVFKDYHVFISQNPFTSTDPNVLLNDPNVESSQLYTTVPFPPEVVPFNNVSGRYVRVQMIGTGFFKIEELEVMGCLSTGGPQNQTITFDPISDKLTTDPPFTINATATSGLPVIFSIQSGPATISGNTITLDGVEGTVIVDANQPGNSNYNAAPTVSQSFNISNPSSGGGCNGTTNIALNKLASQISTDPAFATADLAVDGNVNGSLYGGNSVSQTAWSNDGWWEVDLGEIFEIETIEVWNQVGGNSLANYYVFASDNPFPSYDLTATLNDPNIFNNQNTGAAGHTPPSTVDVNRTGRYVRVQRNGAGFVTLAELMVNGCPVTNTPQIEQGIFTALKRKLDGNYTVTANQKIYFTYPEDYAIVNGENNLLKYKIRNWRNKIVLNGTISNLYGANWQSISLPDPPTEATIENGVPSLLSEFYYVLEIEDISKDENHYMRFQYYFMPEPATINPGGEGGTN